MEISELLHLKMKTIVVDIDRLSNDNWGESEFKVSAQNGTNENLYMMVLGMSRNYDITVYSDQIIGPRSDEVTLIESSFTITNSKLHEVVDTIKVTVSTEKLDKTYFTQAELKPGFIHFAEKDIRDIKRKRAIRKTDWFTKSFNITVSGNLKKLGPNFAKSYGINFYPHTEFSAQLSFAAINDHNRGVDNLNNLPSLLKSSGIEIMNFSPTRDGIDKSIIVLSDIHGDKQLDENPITISLDDSVGNDEGIIPVTFDGEFILPFGDTIKDATNKTIIEIRKLPATLDQNRRSPGRALKFCILKVYFNAKIGLFKLRWVNYVEPRKKRFKSGGIKDKIKDADRILLLLHGIIGNSEQMAHNAEFAIEEKGFDLVLIFDYENLSTPITEIAEKLNERLTDVGLGPGNAKELHLVAHSMGGLVCRYIIEKIRNDDGSVKRLLMFGTPNGGSRLGDIPGYVEDKTPNYIKKLISEKARNWYKFALGISLNFLPGYVRTLVDHLGHLSRLMNIQKPDVLQTLKDMSPHSDFIYEMKTSDPPENTDYYIVAGDITDYESNQNNGWFGRFAEKMEMRIGNVIYLGQPNDVAVSTDNIRLISGIDKDKNATVIPCHHMNYFDHDESVRKWKEWI